MTQSTNHALEGSAFASNATMEISKNAPVSITVDHPRLLDTYKESIRMFFSKSDQYANVVISQARQLASETPTTEPVRPVDIKFCVYVTFLESTMPWGSLWALPCTASSRTPKFVRSWSNGRRRPRTFSPYTCLIRSCNRSFERT